jgi:hypothetical protein
MMMMMMMIIIIIIIIIIIMLLSSDLTTQRPIRKLALTHIDRTVKKEQVI